MPKVMSLYILRCNDGTFYTGVSTDLSGRLLKHETGYYKTCYTYTRRPVLMEYHTEFSHFLLAISWEKRIKKWSHGKKEALIKGDFDALIALSKKKFKK